MPIGIIKKLFGREEAAEPPDEKSAQLPQEHQEALSRREILKRVGEVRTKAGYILRYRKPTQKIPSPQEQAKQRRRQQLADTTAQNMLKRATQKQKDQLMIALQSLSPDTDPQARKGNQMLKNAAAFASVSQKELEAAFYRQLIPAESRGGLSSKKENLQVVSETKQILKKLSQAEKQALFTQLNNSIIKEKNDEPIAIINGLTNSKNLTRRQSLLIIKQLYKVLSKTTTADKKAPAAQAISPQEALKILEQEIEKSKIKVT